MNMPALDAAKLLALAAALTLGAGCSSDLSPILGCEPGFGIDVDCQFQNPEDLALAPDGRILVSQFGDMEGARPGSLAAYDPASRTLTPLFPSNGNNADPAAGEWGDPACAAPDASSFSPHGIDVETRVDGRHALAVVNHGGRESVELFELFEDGSSPGAAAWSRRRKGSSTMSSYCGTVGSGRRRCSRRTACRGR